MKRVLILVLTTSIIGGVFCCCSSNKVKQSENIEISKSIDNMILVEGGKFKNTKSRFASSNKKVESFYIGKNEVTQQEWKEIMENNPSQFKGDDLPVENVTWYDCIEYCNKRSQREGLERYYNIDKDNRDKKNICQYDDIKWSVTVNDDANGYRLPTEAEWEYAAEGGTLSKGFLYSGSDNLEEVGWYWKNSGDKELTGDWNWATIENNNNNTKTVAQKSPNELGIYDMSGNVREWCWDWYHDSVNPDGLYRVVKGGGLIGDAKACENYYKGKFEPNGVGKDQGFRICKNSQ